MKATSAAWVLASCLLVACGGDDTTGGSGGGTSTGTSAGGSPGTGGSTGGSGGSSATTGGGMDTGGGGASSTGGSGGISSTGGAGGGGGAGGSAMMLPADENLCGDVPIMANKIIAAGKVTAICAGANVNVANGMNITVNGTLRVDGTMAMPVKFQGVAHGSTAWAGIILAQGGTLQMTYGEIHDATMPIDARTGSNFTVDHILIDNSRSMLHLASSGTINHGVMHGLMTAQQVDPVIVDGASPKLLNTLIDRGGGKDYIQVNGATSAATFDHLDLTGAHCAFHFNLGNGITISNSNIHGNSYGLMVEGSTNNKITHNNFTQNNPNIGDCGTGSSAMVSENFFMGAPFAANCSKLMATAPAMTAYPATGAGAVGPQP